MFLISITQIPLLVLIVFFIIIAALSSKGILSPKFTLLLFTIAGVSTILNSSFFSSNTEQQIITEPITLTELTPHSDSVYQGESQQNGTQKPISESKIEESETLGTEQASSPEHLIPQEYEVVDARLRTYKIKGDFGIGKPFIEYFEEKAGWKKEKRGNYEIEVSQKGKFTQMDGEQSRIYLYSGGEIEIKVNGNLCCCSSIFSIPKGISDSRLAKAQEKLGQTISDLMFKNKEQVVTALQKCL